MAKPPDDDMDIDTDLQDRIRPEDSVSNLSRRGSITSSIVRSVKERRTAAAKKLLALREESALAEVEAKMKRKRINDQLEFEQRKRQLELEERKRQLELEEMKRQLEMEEKKRMIEEEKVRRQLEDEQLEMSLNAERRRLEAEKELLEAEEEESIVSLARSKVSCKSRSRTSVSIRRPTLTSITSTSTTYRHPSSSLQEVTPYKETYDQEYETKSCNKGMKSTISNPPSYASYDQFDERTSKKHSIIDTMSERSHNISFVEQPRQVFKTMTGNDQDSTSEERAAQEIDLSTLVSRAEAAARAAHAAELAADQHRRTSENIQRIAEQTAQRFADRATESARPQLRMMQEQSKQLTDAISGMNKVTSQNSLMVTKISPFSGKPRDYKRFMANFKTNIESKCVDDSMKLNYLIEHCSDGAQSLIEDCALLGARGYRKAKELLDEEYGPESDIAADYLEFLKHTEQ